MTTIATQQGRTRKPSRRPGPMPLDGMLSVVDWAALPDTKPRYELLNGVLVQKPMTKQQHGKAATELLVECVIWGRSNGWEFRVEGVGLKAGERNGFVPDITGYKPGRVLDPEVALETEPPDFVAEVISRRTAKADRTTKREGYARAGVLLYVIVDPAKKTFEVYRLSEGAYGAPQTLRDAETWQPAELPGLRVELARLWMD